MSLLLSSFIVLISLFTFMMVTRVVNIKIFNFLNINFYAILRYVEQDSEIYFKGKYQNI